MRKKILPQSRLLVYLLPALLVSMCPAGDLEQNKNDIIASIKSGQTAADGIDKLIADYSQDTCLPQSLYEIARNYGWAEKHQEEKGLYQQIIQKYPNSPIANKAKLGCAKADVQSLIISGRFDDAKAALDKLTADFSNHSDLPEALYWIAERYGYCSRYEDERNLCQRIIQNYPDSPVIKKSRLGNSSAEIKTFIVSQEYDKAKESLDKLIVDFDNNPNLPNVLYPIACSYEWSDKYYEWRGKYGQAKDIFEHIVQNYPASGNFDKAKLGVYRMNICSSIIAKKIEAAQDEFNKMMVEFSSHPDLPGTLSYIARRYESSDRYKEANSIYERIITNWPDSSYAQKTKFDIQRAQIKALIASQDYNDANLSAVTLAAADEAIDKFIADFKGHSELPDALYWIAQRYGYSGNWEEEKELYQYIQENYAGSLHADRARVDSAGTDVLTFVVSQNDSDANSTLEKMIADFNSYPYLANAMVFMADKCHDEALRQDANRQDSNSLVKDNLIRDRLYHFVIDMFERYVLDKIGGRDNEAESYYRAAVAAYRLNEPDKTIEYSESVLEADPNFRFAPNMEWFVADGYEKLKKAGKMPAGDADFIIEELYEDLMDRYPGHKIADHGALYLGQYYMRKGDRVRGCSYFGWYLMNSEVLDTSGNDQRVEIIRRVVAGCKCKGCGSTDLPQRGRNTNE